MHRISKEYKSRVVKIQQEFHHKNTEGAYQRMLNTPAEDPSVPKQDEQIARPVQKPIISQQPTPVVPQPRRKITCINDYFDKIFCINLDRRMDRWETSRANFEKQNILVERVSAVDGNHLSDSTGINRWELGCFKSHVNLFQRIISEKVNVALILEDDVDFIDGVQEYFLRTNGLIPNFWSMLYLGGNHINTPIPLNNAIARITRTYTTGSYAITKEAAGGILKLIERVGSKDQIDVTLSEIHKSGNCYSFYPGIAKQRPGFSDIQQGDQDYTKIIS